MLIPNLLHNVIIIQAAFHLNTIPLIYKLFTVKNPQLNSVKGFIKLSLILFTLHLSELPRLQQFINRLLREKFSFLWSAKSLIHIHPNYTSV